MINSVTLERMTFAVHQYISPELAADFGNAPSVQVLEQHVYGGLVVQLRQHVYAQSLDQATVRYPATWRDAVKDRLYSWLRSGHWPWAADLLEPRYPVGWQETTIDVKALYPKIAMPNERHAVHTEQFSDTSTETRRLWFDAKGRDVTDILYQLYYEGRTGRAWAAGRDAYYTLIKTARGYNGDYLIAPSFQSDQSLFGMKIVIDPTVPKDTIELRDVNDRIVGKIYNIG